MPYAAGLSEHPVAAHAVGEAAGAVLEGLSGTRPDLAVLFVTAPHIGALEDVADAVHRLLAPGVLIGATGEMVLGGAHEVEESPALALWAAGLPSQPTPVRLAVERDPEGSRVVGFDAAAAATSRTMLLLADPFSFPVSAFVDELGGHFANLAVIGGLASAAEGPGGNRLVLDGRIHTDGAVGVLLDEEASPATVVSQGCRPIGQPFTVTAAERNVLYELAGRPALDRLVAVLEALTPDDRSLAARGLHCGIVIDERKLDYERGDFLIRGLLGADRDAGAVAVGDVVPVGATVQFQVRDADSADEDLRQLLDGRAAAGALVFTCNGRGTRLFGVPDHDAALVRELLGTPAVGGMSCAGELGPVGGRNRLHGFTASIALFQDRARRAGPLRGT